MVNCEWRMANGRRSWLGKWWMALQSTHFSFTLFSFSSLLLFATWSSIFNLQYSFGLLGLFNWTGKSSPGNQNHQKSIKYMHVDCRRRKRKRKGKSFKWEREKEKSCNFLHFSLLFSFIFYCPRFNIRHFKFHTQHSFIFPLCGSSTCFTSNFSHLQRPTPKIQTSHTRLYNTYNTLHNEQMDNEK